MLRHRFHTALLLVALLTTLGAGAASDPLYLALMPESRLWIEGTTNVDAFACEAATVQGIGTFDGIAAAEVAVPVAALDCGKRRMNEDLYAALRAEAHPEIRFRLTGVVLEAPMEGADYRLRVSGRLALAGAERSVSLPVQARRRTDGTYRASGALAIRMTDFGIDPPTAVLGLVRAHDRITVRFDLVAAARAPIFAH